MAEYFLIFGRMIFDIRFEVEYFLTLNHHFFSPPSAYYLTKNQSFDIRFGEKS